MKIVCCVFYINKKASLHLQNNYNYLAFFINFCFIGKESFFSPCNKETKTPSNQLDKRFTKRNTRQEEEACFMLE